MKKFLSLAFILLLLTAAFADGTEWFKVSFKEAKTKALKLSEISSGFSARFKAAQILSYNGNYNDIKDFFGDEYIFKYIKTLGNNNNLQAIFLNMYSWFWATKDFNLESAKKASKKSIELNENAEFWDTLSTIYLKMKKYEKAVEAEEKAVKLNPDNQNFKKQIEIIRKEMTENNN